jgi:hypothetical protein
MVSRELIAAHYSSLIASSIVAVTVLLSPLAYYHHHPLTKFRGSGTIGDPQ